jgi:phosphate transport system substrate-binding protein
MDRWKSTAIKEDAMKVRKLVSAPSVGAGMYSRPSSTHISFFLILLLSFCSATAHSQDTLVVVGSGSSVPAPLYNRWAQEYGKRNPKVQVRYVPIGTSEGIKQISHGAGDFSAGEAQLTDKERKEGGLIELPAVIIGIVPIYNLPNVHQPLRLSGEVLAEIFLGEVKTWDAPSIVRLNPDVSLPNLRIQVVNRPAGKGSNYVFTDFLSKTSSKFHARIGVTPSPQWPTGTPAERSSDMVDKVKKESGSIGFVELQYAVKGNVSMASVLNPAGKFVSASAETIAAACQAVEAPHWNSFAASMTNAAGADSFPITSFTWIYLRTSTSDSVRAAALRNLLNWIYSEGQQFAVQEGYSELPPPLLAGVRKKVQELH